MDHKILEDSELVKAIKAAAAPGADQKTKLTGLLNALQARHDTQEVGAAVEAVSSMLEPLNAAAAASEPSPAGSIVSANLNESGQYDLQSGKPSKKG